MSTEINLNQYPPAQLIATAPKDGRFVLIFIPKWGGWNIAKWVDKEGYGSGWVPAGMDVNPIVERFYDEYENEDYPTHWLPEPPDPA